MTDFPVDFIFFGRPSRKRIEGGEGITIQKNSATKLTFVNDNPFGFTKTDVFHGEIVNIPSGFQLVVHGEFNVADNATVSIQDGGALIVL